MVVRNNIDIEFEYRVGNYSTWYNDRDNTRLVTDYEFNSLVDMFPGLLNHKISLTPFIDLNNLSIGTSCSVKAYRLQRQINGGDRIFISIVFRPLPNNIRYAFSPNTNIWQRAYVDSDEDIDVFDERFKG